MDIQFANPIASAAPRDPPPGVLEQYTKVTVAHANLAVAESSELAFSVTAVNDAVVRRNGYRSRGAPPSGSDKHSCKFVDGVIQITTASGATLPQPPYYSQYLSDLAAVDEMQKSGPIKSFAHQRLAILEHKFELYKSLNAHVEARALKEAAHHKDFQNVTKVDMHIRLAGAASPQLLVDYMKQELAQNAQEVVKGKTTLAQAFSVLGLEGADLSVQGLKNTDERSAETFNLFGSELLQEIFLEPDYRTDKVAARLTRKLLDDLDECGECGRVVKNELHIPLYGIASNDIQTVGKWVNDNNLYSENSRWVVQIPRSFQAIKKSGKFKTFGDYVESIFRPIFEVSNNPSSSPALHQFLLSVCSFDSIGDEQSENLQTVRSKSAPDLWTDDPRYNHQLYFIYANLFAVNQLREAKQLNTFSFRPHCGETGSVAHLAAGFLLADGIVHGLNMHRSAGGVQQYLYYLTQIPMTMSPLCNDLSVWELDQNPFPKFFRRGLNVSLSTDNPLHCHNVDDPLMEEYFSASQAWGLSEIDLCEVARTSVMNSGLREAITGTWAPADAAAAANAHNDSAATLVPDIRIRFRRDTLSDEYNFLQATAVSITPTGATAGTRSTANNHTRLNVLYPDNFSDMDMKVSDMFNHIIARRSDYVTGSSKAFHPPPKAKYTMERGIMQVKGKNAKSQGFPEAAVFSRDLAKVMSLVRNNDAKMFAQRRLEFIEQCFQLHLQHNGAVEHDEVRHEKADFYTLKKLNNGTLRSMLQSEHIVEFIQQNVAAVDEGEAIDLFDGEELSIHEYFQQLEGCYRGGMESRDIELLVGAAILNSDNVTAGRLLGALTRELVDSMEAEGNIIELTLPIIGYHEDEWDCLADWIRENKLIRPLVRFRISVIVSEYPDIRLDKSVRNFEHYLSNFFWSPFAASIDPRDNRDVNELLKNVTGIEIHSLFRTAADDIYSGESKSAFQLNWFKVSPNLWSSADVPPIEYVEYFFYANMAALNYLRAARQLKTFSFLPFVSSNVHSSPRQLACGFLLGDQVRNGLSLQQNSQLQYVYYLKQIAISCSPVSERVSYTRYSDHPFGLFFRRGLNVCLQASDQEHRRITRHPLLDEFFLAKRTWGLSNVDLCELACNGLKTKAIGTELQNQYIGSVDPTGENFQNDKSKSNIPDIRFDFRQKVLIDEMSLLESLAENYERPVRKPQEPTCSFLSMSFVVLGATEQTVNGALQEREAFDLEGDGYDDDDDDEGGGGGGCFGGCFAVYGAWTIKREDSKINNMMSENERLKSKLDALVGEGPGQGYNATFAVAGAESQVTSTSNSPPLCCACLFALLFSSPHLGRL